ncbi:MAG: SDR family oxidoreductase, partial [Planctomycetes bacterium]|nr:SDR family oxidoreductase [Planctomycetota bacterium]
TQPKHMSPEEAGRHLDGAQPWPQHGRGEDIAGAAVFLASEDSAFVSGQEIVVDGGLTALGPDMWQRIDMPREATLTKAYLSKGTTGEPGTARKL